MSPRPITTLELRQEPRPDSAVIDLYEQLTETRLWPQYRHYLENKPIHCGDFLELHRDGQWIPGRYEWTARLDDLPTFHHDDGVLDLDATSLLRWPKS